MKKTGPSDAQRKFQITMKEPHTEICVHKANPWVNLQNFFEQILKERNPDLKTQQWSKHALEYVVCWKKLGYTYEKLKQLVIRDVGQQVKNNENGFQRDQWFRLNKIRSTFPAHISLSFLVDRTVEYFKFFESGSQSGCQTISPAPVISKRKKDSVRKTLLDMESLLQKHSVLINIGLSLNRHNSYHETAQQLEKLEKILNE